jgi:multicomponent Na+:H+ antiporter subunit E
MIVRSAALLLIWLALWGEVSIANLASGVVVVALLNWLFVEDLASTYRVRIVPAVRLLGFIGWSLVASSARVVAAVLLPTPQRTVTSVQQVQLESGSTFIGSIVANAITLTPGTMSLELDPDSLTLSVHVLGEVEPEAFRRGILDLEQRVVRAVSKRGGTP